MKNAFKVVIGWSLVAALLTWGLMLTPFFTATGAQRSTSIYPQCRAAGSRLDCVQSMKNLWVGFDAGATVWQELPAEYFYSHQAEDGQPSPKWNPYIGSGYPMFLDGIFNLKSLITKFLIHHLGDKARDLVIFSRIFVYILGVVTALYLLGVSRPILILGALTASVAHYLSFYVDIVFLDIDLIAPWLIVLLLILQRQKRLTFFSVTLAVLCGWWVGTQGFVESQANFAIVVALVTLLALRHLGWRALALGLFIGVGFSVGLTRLLLVLHNLPNLYTTRDVMTCVAASGIGWREALYESLLIFWQKGPTLTFIMPIGALALVLWKGWQKKETRWLLLSLTGLVYLEIFGLPRVFCSFPGISGVSLVRHLVPYVNAFSLVLILWSLHLALAHTPKDKYNRRFLVLAAVCCFPIWHNTFFNWEAITHHAAKPLPPLVRDLSSDSPLGQVQKRSQTEDRRHFSAQEILYPNWSQAFDILDMRVLYGIHPANILGLNNQIFSNWKKNGGALSRILQPEDPQDNMNEDLQRDLIINRVSLLSFLKGQAVFSNIGGPYSREKCQLLAQNNWIESYLCPQVGAVGFFPRDVKVLPRERQIAYLKQESLDELNGLALISSESIQAAGGSVISFQRQADQLIYNLNVERAGLFVVADTFFPGWEAKINGVSAPIHEVNYAFKGVIVPEGKIKLELTFKPKP